MFSIDPIDRSDLGLLRKLCTGVSIDLSLSRAYLLVMGVGIKRWLSNRCGAPGKQGYCQTRQAKGHDVSTVGHSKNSSLAQRHQAKKKDLRKSGLLMMVPVVGFELTTYRLQGGCSTN